MFKKNLLFPSPLFSLFILSIFSACSPGNKSTQTSTPESVTSLQLPATTKWRADWSKENTAVVHILADPDNLHPTNGTSQTRAEINLYIHMSLLQTDLRTSELRAGLCKSLPAVSPDQLKLTFELRDEPKWDDGSAITAEDVIFTAKAAKCPLTNNPAAKPYFENVKELIADASNLRRFTVIMKRPYIQNLALWSDYPIIQRAFYDSANVLSKYTFAQMDDASFKATEQKDLSAWADNFNDASKGFDPKQINGMGPYQLDAWTPGQSLILKKKNNHWATDSKNYWEASLPEKIIFKINRDAASQKLEFKSQTYDGSAYIGIRTLFDLQADSAFNLNYHSKFMDTYGYTYIALNMKPDGVKHLPLLTDVNVRKALAYAAPVDEIIKVVNRGVNKRVNGPVSLLKKVYNNKLDLIPFDTKKANKLLDEAGWKDTDGNGIRDKVVDGKKLQLEIELAYLSTQVEWKEMSMMMAEGMAKAGVKVNAVAYDFPIWLEKANTHNFDMIMGSWNASSAPEDYSQLWTSTAWSSNGQNYTGFGDAATDAMIDSLNFTFDMQKRFDLEQKIQEKIYEQQPYIFMYQLARRCIVHKRFNNAEFYAERPGLLYNNLRVATNSVSAQ